MIKSFAFNKKFCRSIILSQNFIVSSAVSLLHFLVLGFLIFKFNNEVPPPVLSFSLTMADVAGSSNNMVSMQASIASKSPSKSSEKITSDNSLPQVSKKESKEEIEDISKTKLAGKKSANSMEQTAVLNPTTPAIYDAAYLSNASPEYPNLSRRLGEQGLVVLNIFVSIEGKAEKIEIKNSSGYKRLDMAALETVRNWRFISAKNHNQTISSWVEVPVNFVLEKNNG